MEVKVNSAWANVREIYMKSNGVWSVFEGDFDEGIVPLAKRYGGNIAPAGPDVTDDEYTPDGAHEPNTNIIYNGTAGKPNVKTNENGKVVEYTFTDTGVTVSDVHTGIIAFDSTNPGFHIHLVAEFVPSASTETNSIISANDGRSTQGLTIYSSGNYLYMKIKTQAYDTSGSKYKAWSYFSPTGRDTSYYKNRNTVTFDLILTDDKKFTMTVNGKETDYTDYSFAADFNDFSIKIGNGISNFTINELTVTKG